MPLPSRLRPLCLAFAPLFLNATVQAAESRDDAVVVTATRIATRVNETTSDITLVDREQIERGGPTLREVMRMVPGVELSQSGGEGSVMGLLLRGTNSDQIGRAHV